MTDKPTDEALENLFVEETGFDIDDFPAAIFDFARAVLAKWGQPAQAAEPVARLVIGKTKGGVSLTHMVVPAAYQLQEGTYALYTTPQPTHAQAGAVPQAGEYPALVCDYCGALTPDPWHSSGMLHGKMSKHIHSCDACAARGAAEAQAGAVPLTDEQTKALMQAHRTAMLMTCKAKVPECGEFAAIAQDLDWLCESFGIKGGQHGDAKP